MLLFEFEAMQQVPSGGDWPMEGTRMDVTGLAVLTVKTATAGRGGAGLP